MRVGRYELFGPLATGGMASVHFGKLFGQGGFQKVVAIKVPHVAFVRDPEFRAMFLDEARIVARIQSQHVVATLDIVEETGTLYHVMEYANGPSLGAILQSMRARSESIPIPVALAILVDVLDGLHVAHEAKDDRGMPLHVVHRDVSPQNVIVTDEGLAKILDFGIASATGKLHLTQPGDMKGKISYMAPEQIEGRPVDRRVDVYACGVVLYETLTGSRLFVGENFAATALMHVRDHAPDVRDHRADVPPELAAIIATALEKKASARFPTARAMADALLALPLARATPREVAEWSRDAAREFFIDREARLAALPTAADEEAAPSVVAGSDATLGKTEAEGKRHKMPLRWVAGALLVGGAGAAGIALQRHNAARPVEAPSAASSAATVTASSELSRSAPTEVSGDAVEPTSEPAQTPVHRRTPHHAPAIGEPRAQAGPSHAARSNEPSPNCCVGDLRLQLTNCVDNCPHTKGR